MGQGFRFLIVFR